MPAGCAPLGCDDGDACTDDSCDPVAGCVHEPRIGFPAVACRLDALAEILATTPATELGGPAVQERLRVKIARVRVMVAAGQVLQGNHRSRRLNRATDLLASFIKSVKKGGRRGKIDPEVADRMLELATGAQSRLQPLLPG
jgi:hypothetical protein